MFLLSLECRDPFLINCLQSWLILSSPGKIILSSLNQTNSLVTYLHIILCFSKFILITVAILPLYVQYSLSQDCMFH